MSMRINQNILAQSTYSHLSMTNNRLETSIGKLSSGLRINCAADDAAGLAISEKMRRQIRGLNRAKLNAQDGISLIQTAEGAMGETQSIIQRMRELALQSANDTLTSNDRLEIQKEVEQLKDQVDTIAQSTEFNTKKLLNGNQSALISASSNSAQGFVTGPVGQGGDYTFQLKTASAGVSQVQTSQMMKNRNTGELCAGNTMLEDIDTMYTPSGEFCLESPQTLTLTGNGRTAYVNVDSKMTINELTAAFQNAIATESGLGIEGSNAQVTSVHATGDRHDGGYISITSGAIGENGNFTIAGGQDIMDALGFSVSRESVDSLVEVSMNDAYGNKKNITTSSGKASLLEGIDVKFDSQPGQVAGLGGIVDGVHISAAAKIVVSVAGKTAVTLSFPAGDWSMEGLAEAANAKIAANADAKGFSASIVDGELRLNYKPVGVDGSNSNFKITAAEGPAADTLGIKVGTYNGFADGVKDQAKAIKGVRNLAAKADNGTVIEVGDAYGKKAVITVAAGAIEFGKVTSAKSDLTEIGALLDKANNEFKKQSAAIRADAVNGSLVFTSTMLGEGSDSVKSKVELKVTRDADSAKKMFGLQDSVGQGSGDTTFKVHVVNTEAQFQIGADKGDNMKIGIADLSAEALGIDTIDLTSVSKAEHSLEKLNIALDKVSSERAKLGAYQNRLNYTISNVANTSVNLTASESRIRDVDVAQEMIEFTRNQIISQSGMSMLAQANAIPQNVLSLLG